MSHLSKNIRLRHLLIDEKKQIGIQFYPDKVIQAIIKQLPHPKWSKRYGMTYILNTKDNLEQVFEKFRGFAWINCNYFFADRQLRNDNELLDIDWFRRRNLFEGYRKRPEEYFEKLEIKNYSMSTTRIYIGLFETFLNYHKDVALIKLNENNIRA